MPEYLSPGVYVEEVETGPKPIEGVSTSTAGAVGVTVRGPTTGKPELVTSFPEFVRKFGGYLPEQDPGLQNRWNGNANEGGRWWQFPLSVKGFFDNGGQRLYVKRVFAGGGLPQAAQTAANTAVASSGVLARGLVAEIESDANADGKPVELTVRHLFGLAAETAPAAAGGAPGPGTQVTLHNGETNQQIGGNFRVRTYDPVSRRITLDAPLPANTDVRRLRGDVVVIQAPVAVPPPATPIRVQAKARGAWGDEIRVQARPMVGPTVTLLYDQVNGGGVARAVVDTLTPPAAPGGVWVVKVRAAAAGQPPALTGFANNDRVTIAGAQRTITNVNLGANTFEIPTLPAGAAAGTPILRLRLAHNHAQATNQLRVWGASRLYDGAVVELDNGSAKEVLQVGAINGDVVTFSANLANKYHEGQKVRVVEVELTVQYRPGGQTQVEERFTNLRLVGRVNDPGYIVTSVNAASKLIELSDGGVDPSPNLTELPIAPIPPAGFQRGWLPLQNGDDRLDQLSVDDFVGFDGGSGNRTGIQALEDIDEISICMVPGVWSRTVHGALIQHCETLKDRFGVIDPPDKLDIEGVRTFREVYDTKYAALYYPYIEVRDPIVKRDVALAPSAHMLGIYARVDVDRGVHKAPANEVIRGITKIAQDVTKREQDMLNPKGINALRFFPTRSNRVWGARTLSSDTTWKYINVRRLFIFVEESIDEGTQFVVFEPNYEATWARVRQTITNFLTTVWRNGALEGTKPDEAFFVKCDRTTMSQDDIDNGRLICVIGIAPVKPAEFVIFRIQQKTLESQPS